MPSAFRAAFTVALMFAALVAAGSATGPHPTAKDSLVAKPTAASMKTAPAKPPAKTAAAKAVPAAKDSPARKAPAENAHAAKPVPAASASKADSLSSDTLPKPLRNLGQKALKVPEKLLFDIIWGGWSFRWVTAGQATLELLPTDRPEAWKIQSLAWCNGFFQSFYPVKDTVTSVIDSRGIYPLLFDKRLHEGKYHAHISAAYDQAAHTLKTQDTTLSIEPFTHDVLSAFYFIRTQTLKVGDSLELAAVSGKKKYKLKVLCHARETIRVPAGEFRTLVVEPVLKGDGLFKAKGKLTIWVTDDESHTPVKMMSKIPVGSIKAELVRKG